MANYYGVERTNYFKVKDADAFKAWAGKFGFEVIESKTDDRCLYGLLPNTSCDDGCFSIWSDDDEHVEFVDELSKHLAEGEIAVAVGCGNEKYRYVCGYATAVDHVGQQISLSINDIYARAASFFGGSIERITRAEY